MGKMDSYNPLVSIIINTHNSTRYLQEAIESAYRQTYANTEIIVYDNASTADVYSLVSGYDTRLKYYRSEEYLTLGKARNKALEIAQGELVDFLDADDIFLPEKLEKQVPLFKNPNLALVHSNTCNFWKKNGIKEEVVRHKKRPPETNIFRELLISLFISFDTAIFRKDVIGPVPEKWFCEEFNMCTDYELFLRISHDHEILYVDEVLAKHREHDENLSKTRFHTSITERLMMIPIMLEYEPHLFEKYPKEMKLYLAAIYRSQAKLFKRYDFRKECIFSTWHAFFLSYEKRDLVRALGGSIFSDKQLQKLRSIF